MYLARKHTGMSFPEIGRAVGNKNHSTVIAACQRVENMSNGGELVCWTADHNVRHQAMPEVLGALGRATAKELVRPFPIGDFRLPIGASNAFSFSERA